MNVAMCTLYSHDFARALHVSLFVEDPHALSSMQHGEQGTDTSVVHGHVSCGLCAAVVAH